MFNDKRREEGEEKESTVQRSLSSMLLLSQDWMDGRPDVLTVTHVKELNQYDRHVTMDREREKIELSLINGKTRFPCFTITVRGLFKVINRCRSARQLQPVPFHSSSCISC